MLSTTLDAAAYLDHLIGALEQLNLAALHRWSDHLYRAWQERRFVFLCGNGGSATTASHMAEDLGKCLLTDQELQSTEAKRLKVLSLSENTGWLTALANDLDYESIFVQQLANFASPGDLLIAISGSGNSPNVLRAAEWSSRAGLVTFGLTGFDGGQLKQIQQDGLHLPVEDLGLVESLQLALFHWVLGDLFARIHETGRYAL